MNIVDEEGKTLQLKSLGEISVEKFLREYWQKKPLFIPQALSEFPISLTAESLAGLCLEPDVESRLIIETPKQDRLDSDWRIEHGPLSEDRFANLPTDHWTILVQAVDQIDTSVHKLLNLFRFLPNWRLDDVMASYAAEQGSAGPHFDLYDVFLLQGAGKRRWKIGQHCNEQTALRPDTEMKILTHFDTVAEYVAEPGDLLYIPPRIAHWGVAETASLTYSIGFRAPSHSELLLELSQELASLADSSQRYEDKHSMVRENPGEISSRDIAYLREILMQHLTEDSSIAKGFAQMMTAPTRQTNCEYPRSQNGPWQLSPNARAAYININNQCLLFINGLNWACKLATAEAVCQYSPIDFSTIDKADHPALTEWLAEELLCDAL